MWGSPWCGRAPDPPCYDPATFEPTLATGEVGFIVKLRGVHMHTVSEGQIYEGTVSISGESGPYHRWMVIAPFGRVHALSIDNPFDPHCLPLHPLQRGLESGRLRYVESEADHPMLQLQRVKELHQVRDTHLGLAGDNIDKMLAILEDAIEKQLSYAPYAAAEILTLLSESLCAPDQEQRVRNRVYDLVPDARPAQSA